MLGLDEAEDPRLHLKVRTLSTGPFVGEEKKEEGSSGKGVEEQKGAGSWSDVLLRYYAWLFFGGIVTVVIADLTKTKKPMLIKSRGTAAVTIAPTTTPTFQLEVQTPVLQGPHHPPPRPQGT